MRMRYSRSAKPVFQHIRNTNAPEDAGTWIVESTCHQSKYTITGIAGKKGFVSVNIDKDMMNSEVGFWKKSFIRI